jgi:type VI secretion system protein ImpC
MASEAGPSAKQAVQSETTSESTSGLLDRIVEEGRLGQSPEERKEGKEWINAFLDQVLKNQVVVSKDTDAMLTARIAQIDKLLSDQLNETMHAPGFQKLGRVHRFVELIG